MYVVLTEWSMLSVWTDTDLDISRHRSRQCSYQPYHQHPSLSCRDISFLTKLLCLTLIKFPSLLDMACTGIKTLPSLCPASLWLESWRIRTCVSVCYLNNKWQKLLLSRPDICQSFLLLGIVLLCECDWQLHSSRHTGNIIAEQRPARQPTAQCYTYKLLSSSR